MTFTTMTTDQLIKTVRFHDADRGTTTMQQELRRMWILQEAGEELRRRGVDPYEEKAA